MPNSIFLVYKFSCYRLILCRSSSSEYIGGCVTVTMKARKLSYREDDRAMRPMYKSVLKIFGSPRVRPRLLFPKFVMGFCSDQSHEREYKI